MHVRNVHEQQSINPAYKQPSTEVMIATIDAQLKDRFHPKEGDIVKTESKTPTDPACGRTEGII